MWQILRVFVVGPHFYLYIFVMLLYKIAAIQLFAYMGALNVLIIFAIVYMHGSEYYKYFLIILLLGMGFSAVLYK